MTLFKSDQKNATKYFVLLSFFITLLSSNACLKAKIETSDKFFIASGIPLVAGITSFIGALIASGAGNEKLSNKLILASIISLPVGAILGLAGRCAKDIE